MTQSALDEIEPVVVDDANDAEAEAIKLRKEWDLGVILSQA